MLSFFERAPGAHDEIIVRRVDTSTSGLKVHAMTVDELVLHLGYVLPMDPDRSAAQSEELLTQFCFGIAIRILEYESVPDDPDIFTYKLSNAQDTDDAFWESRPLATHTRFAVVRKLESDYGWDRRVL